MACINICHFIAWEEVLVGATHVVVFDLDEDDDDVGEEGSRRNH